MHLVMSNNQPFPRRTLASRLQYKSTLTVTQLIVSIPLVGVKWRQARSTEKETHYLG